MRLPLILLQFLFGVALLLANTTPADASGEGLSNPPRIVPGGRLDISPIPGLTTEWYQAPETIPIPLGTTIRFKRLVPSGYSIEWFGATEISNEGGWSVAECRLNTIGTHLVIADLVLPSGDRSRARCQLDIKDISPAQIDVSLIDVAVDPIVLDWDDLNASAYKYFRQPSIAALHRIAADRYRTSIHRWVEFKVEVDPPEFAPLIEWRYPDNNRIRTRLGASLRFYPQKTGTHNITIGQQNSQPIYLETYSVEITSQESYIDLVREGLPVTFTARTQPPGFEDQITWLSSTKYGSSYPVLGRGPVFVTEFNDTWGQLPDGEPFQWLGVRADDTIFNQDQKKIIKVVPIKFCIVSDGRDVDDPGDSDDGRFNEDKRTAGLLQKSLIWSQAGILFKPQGFIIVGDPDPAPGQTGDVRDLGQDGKITEQWLRVIDACDAAIGQDAKEKLVDILIRQFVDENGDAQGAFGVGWSNVPGCTELSYVDAKPMVNDPDTFTAFELVHSMDIDNFVETLAHENGHAFCLPHAGSGNPGDHRLMTGDSSFGNDVLSQQERDDARGEAQKISGTIDKNKQGERLPNPRPRSREAVDDRGDVPEVWTDLVDSTAVRMADGNLSLNMGLAGLVPDNITGLEYVFMVDVDNDTGTGGSPFVSFTHSFTGADLIAEIAASKTAGVPSVTVAVKRFEAGAFVEIVDSRIEANLVTLTVFAKGAVGDFPVKDVIASVLPDDLLPLPIAEGYRVGSFAFDSNTAELDTAPIVIGSITEFPEPTSILIEPVSGAPGDTIAITGEFFFADSTVDIFFGTQLVATISTDGEGRFEGSFQVPKISDDTAILEPISGRFVSPVTAVDRTIE